MAHSENKGNKSPISDGRARLSEEPKGGSLGIVAKTSSPIDFKGLFCRDTGEVLDTEISSKGEVVLKPDLRKSRSERWAMKSVVNRLLPKEKTAQCMVLRAPSPMGGLSDIELCKSDSLKKAFYQGLIVCGRVWTCPLCAAKISERRRIELREALEVAKTKNYAIHFVTLTFPHGISDDLNEILPKMTKAYGKLANGKYSVKSQLKSLDDKAQIHGFIRAVEVTHGKNGFHPHVHMIVFTDSGTGSNLLEYVYRKAWQRACRLSDLPVPSDQHGCTVQDGSFADEYASKWGIEDEMTKANQKRAKNKGMTPWGFLRCVVDGDNPDYPPERAESLFRVYAKAFKGKRQLYWSNGLRALLSMSKETTDEELAQKPDDERAHLLASITVEQWKAIRKAKQEANLISVAELNPSAVSLFIQNLTLEPLREGTPPRGRGCPNGFEGEHSRIDEISNRTGNYG